MAENLTFLHALFRLVFLRADESARGKTLSNDMNSGRLKNSERICNNMFSAKQAKRLLICMKSILQIVSSWRSWNLLRKYDDILSVRQIRPGLCLLFLKSNVLWISLRAALINSFPTSGSKSSRDFQKPPQKPFFNYDFQ